VSRLRPTFPRFSELDRERCNVDHHIHTKWTDGHGTVREVLDTAERRGLSSIAFTEHVRRDSGEWFTRFVAEIRREAAEAPALEVLVGCEAKALDLEGRLDTSEEVLGQCDIVLGSVHRWPDGVGGLVNFAEIPYAEFADIEASYALGLVRSAPIDVLAHPGGMFQRRHGAFPEHLMRELVVATRERGIAIEISSSYLRDVPAFLDLCREIDPFVSIGSDAHTLDDIGRCRDVVTAVLHGWRDGACA
jgi:putative hydrolase